MPFQNLFSGHVSVEADNVRQLIVRSGMHESGAAQFSSDPDNPVTINGCIDLIQTTARVQTTVVQEYLAGRSQVPGGIAHIAGLLIANPALKGFVAPAGRDITKRQLETAIGGPIVALCTPCGQWCAVLCDDANGPKFTEGNRDGGGWARGTIFVAVPTPTFPSARLVGSSRRVVMVTGNGRVPSPLVPAR